MNRGMKDNNDREMILPSSMRKINDQVENTENAKLDWQIRVQSTKPDLVVAWTC